MLKEQRSHQVPGRPWNCGAGLSSLVVPYSPASPPAPPPPQPPWWEQRQHSEGQWLIFSPGKAGACEQPSRLSPLARGSLLLPLPLLKRVPRASAHPAAPQALQCWDSAPNPPPPRLASPTSPIPPQAQILSLPREEEDDAGISPRAGGCRGPAADGSSLFMAP